MIYIISLKYIRPIEEVKAHLDTHRQWLATHARAGRILAAGPCEDQSGGIVLAHCRDRAEVDAMVAEDSFMVHRVAEAAVQGFEPAIRAAALGPQWAGNAAVVVD